MANSISFGTDGWRAVIANDFTFANVERVAYAIGRYVQETYHKGMQDGIKVPVLVGYDTRFLADKFAFRAAQVLIAMGVPARLSARDVPTPSIAWSAQLGPTAGAIQVTASHNPPEYCGMKYIPHFGGPATNAVTEQIVAYLNEMPGTHKVGEVDVPIFDPKPPYLAALNKQIDFERIRESRLSVAYDALYSTSREYLDRILLDAGVNCRVLHNWRDPLFGGGMPEPKEEYLKELINLVKQENLHVGLATDGDADRFGVVDDLGNYLAPNQLLALVARHLIKNRGQRGAIVRTVATTHLLDKLARQHGLELIETPVGFKYIGEIMRAKDVLIGGEESGGISVKGHIPEKDGILGNLLIVELMAYEQKPLSRIWIDLLEEVGAPFVYRRADFSFSLETQRRLMERLCANPFSFVAGEKVEKVEMADGLKFYLDPDNWVLIRPSGTEPLLRLYFEATSKERVDRLKADFQNQVESLVSKLGKDVAIAIPAKVETRP